MRIMYIKSKSNVLRITKFACVFLNTYKVNFFEISFFVCFNNLEYQQVFYLSIKTTHNNLSLLFGSGLM